MKDNPETQKLIEKREERISEAIANELYRTARIESETFTTSLSRLDVETLALVPYEQPGFLNDRWRRKLLKLGLIEKNPMVRGQVRCTQQGTDVVLRFRQQGWIP